MRRIAKRGDVRKHPLVTMGRYFSFEKMMDENFPKLLPVPHDNHCCGSSLGWLVLGDDSFNMDLFNPLSGLQFELPSPTTLAVKDLIKFDVHKTVISQEPTAISTSIDTIVVIIHEGPRLAFCKLGDQLWTPIIPPWRRCYIDVIYYDHKFYTLDYSCRCDIVDFDHNAQYTISEYICQPLGAFPFIVESKGELFSAERVIHCDDDDVGGTTYYKTSWFRVFKLEDSNGKREWKKVKDIGDSAFFVGFSTSFSLPASQYRGSCKPNSIYFRDDWWPIEDNKVPEVQDMGVFNLKDRSVNSIFSVDSCSMTLS